MKTIATLATTATLAFAGVVFVAPPALADQHCVPGEGSCVVDPPAEEEPCTPGQTYVTGGICVLPGGQAIPDPDWSSLLLAAERKAVNAEERASEAEQATQAAVNARRIAEQAADTYRLQTIELTAEVTKLERRLDRKSATIKRLRAKIRDLRQN